MTNLSAPTSTDDILALMGKRDAAARQIARDVALGETPSTYAISIFTHAEAALDAHFGI